MHSYIIQTCGGGTDRESKQQTSLHTTQERQVKKFFVPPVPPSGLRWHFPPPLLSSPFQTWHDNCCFAFSISIKKNSKRHRSWCIAGRCRDGIAFSMTTVKWAACWHSKPQSKERLLQIIPQPSLFSSSCQNAIPGPCPGQPSYLLWIKDTGAEVGRDNELWALGSASPFFLSLLQSLHFLFPLLHLSV